MTKLLKKDKFIDISDYGRPFAKQIVNLLKSTNCTPIHLTIAFGICGIIAIYNIYHYNFLIAAIFLLLKSILDAADGELARVKNTPSYTGRYLDSIFDCILNFFILLAISTIANTNFWLFIFAFLSMQMQGTLYNYYYVILRNKVQGGDTTSKIFEYKVPKAFDGESQNTVNIMYHIFNILYSFFDKTIHLLDANAIKAKVFPNWFMTLVSTLGLGSQLLIIAVLLNLNLANYIIPFFIINNISILLFIATRKNI